MHLTLPESARSISYHSETGKDRNMRDISHGVRCARLLARTGELISHGIEYTNGRQQAQVVALGPVGNRIYRVEFRDGRYWAAKQAVKESGKYEPGERVLMVREEGYDDFVKAYSMALRWFAADLTAEQVTVDYMASYNEYMGAVKAASFKAAEKEVAPIRETVAGLRAERKRLTAEVEELTRQVDAALRQKKHYTRVLSDAMASAARTQDRIRLWQERQTKGDMR